MFIDESGEANVITPDPRFNIFVLCGIIFGEDHYNAFNEELKTIKRKYFNTENIIFHSFEMRNKTGPFKIFQNPSLLQEFYVDIGRIFKEANYKIFCCVVDKSYYKNKYNENNAYEDCLIFLCERAIKYIGTRNGHILHFCLEKRNKRKDVRLKKYYTQFIKYGTQYISTKACEICHPKLHFRGKDENINGLQFADLCAYPIARKNLSPDKPQPTFDLIEPKFHCDKYGNYEGIGLKRFPKKR
jgi:hypothetical protein